MPRLVEDRLERVDVAFEVDADELDDDAALLAAAPDAPEAALADLLRQRQPALAEPARARHALGAPVAQNARHDQRVDRRQRADRREAQDAADRDRQPEAAQLVQELVRDGRLELEPRGPTGQARVDQRDRRAPPLFSRARVVAGAVQVFFVLLESLQHAPPELGDFIGLGAVVDAPHGAALRGARFLREGRVRVSYDAVQGALPVVGGLLVRQRDDRREPPALRGAQRQRRRGRGRVFRRGPAVR
mmetsp:Transcript_17901/g.55045  ORF Transcript_17901/g.55045 Transcript_17901/m.55045 type:complete len:246 (-) Transcript_17901:135-872(-)